MKTDKTQAPHTAKITFATLLLSLVINSPILGQVQLEVGVYPDKGQNKGLEPQVMDLRYAPVYWQSVIGLPADPHKTVVSSNGTLLYNFDRIPYDFKISEPDFELRIGSQLVGINEYTPRHQYLYNARTPIVITESKVDGLVLKQQTWARAPESGDVNDWAPKRVDYLWLKMMNKTDQAKSGQIKLEIASADDLTWDGKYLAYLSDAKAQIFTLDPVPSKAEKTGEGMNLYFTETKLSPGEEQQVLVTLFPGKFDKPFNHDKEMYRQYETYRKAALSTKNTAPFNVKEAKNEFLRAVEYWKNGVALPYGRINVPDINVQRQLDASIRNIYQASEHKDGNFVIQIGPGHYRGSWAADGPFFMEALAYLGKWKDARVALESQFDNDTTDPAGLTFYKRSGLRLWMVRRHAELTGDRVWLEKVWPKVKRDLALIKRYREMSLEDDTPLNDGLMPRGSGDGGLGGKEIGTRESGGLDNFNEYTNVYWNLAGLKSAINMAEKLNKPVKSDWQSEYDEFYEAFEHARKRDELIDPYGNRYVPVTMRGEVPQLPQRGAWAFMHSVHPGEVYEKDDPFMRGMMDMLDAAQRQGTVYGTGWLAHGIWNYFASFYAHAHLWLGHGKKAASTLYAFGNHASPTLVWVEEQYPVGQMRGEIDWGDMPHNWASAEFIRLVRHLMIFERGSELHLLEGMPEAWTQPGDQTQLTDISTTFGNISLTVKMAEDGQSASITVDPPKRQIPGKIVLHLERFERPVWTITANDKYISTGELVEILPDKPTTIDVEFKHIAEKRYSQLK